MELDVAPRLITPARCKCEATCIREVCLHRSRRLVRPDLEASELGYLPLQAHDEKQFVRPPVSQSQNQVRPPSRIIRATHHFYFPRQNSCVYRPSHPQIYRKHYLGTMSDSIYANYRRPLLRAVFKELIITHYVRVYRAW
jgi:hypothetical protein